MGFYSDQILPRLVNLACSAGAVTKERKKALAGVEGIVLEVGFGSGLNVPHYPASVKKLVALDPSVVGKKLARSRIEAAPFPIEHLALSGEEIPADAATFDAVVSTYTLCTIPNVKKALSEIRRVLEPSGKLYFLEHGRAPDPKVARWQDRLNGIQNAIAGGCHLNRDMEALIRTAGFVFDVLDRHYAEGTPKFMGFLYRGIAAPSS